MAQDPTLPPAGDAKARQMVLVANILRVAGAFFMIGGTVCGFNVFGIAEAMGLADGFTEKVFGCVLFAAGVIDFMVMPRLLEKSLPK